MSNRRPDPDHQAAVSRRLAMLNAELDRSSDPPWTGGADPVGHTRIRPAVRVADSTAWRPAPLPPPPPAAPPAATGADPDQPGAAPWAGAQEWAGEPSHAPAIPVPGRHASRRRRSVFLPLPMRGEVALGPVQVTVLALAIAVALAVTCWWLVRSDAREVAAPGSRAPAASASPLAELSPVAARAGATADGAATGSVTVDVAGKVRKPGIAVLDAGSRVVDALEAAGGPRRGVDLTSLNLARVLVDGEQILVGVAAPAGAVVPDSAGTGVSSTTPGALVNLNTATAVELESLPQVGPVTAAAIIAWRDEHGGFRSVEELLEVDGIGDATLAQVAPHVTV